jgi:LacI family transcriptional regulator
MATRVTMTDIARAAGVSLMTVSRVVNNKDDVSKGTRLRVQEVIDSLGYRPSGIARGLVTQHTSTLGLVVPDIDNPFFSGVVRGAENTAYAEGYSVFLGNTNEDPERELALLRSLDEKLVDGAILCSSRLDDESLVREISRFPTAVLISRQVHNDGTGVLVIDDEAGGRLATEHLLGSGHCRIGIISGPPISFSSQHRLAGYRAALQAAGLPINPAWVRHCKPVVENGYQAAVELLRDCPELTALVCHNDMVAFGALQACAELGRSVPQDVAVVGYDDVPMAALVSPPLTTIKVSPHAIGSQAMRMLLERIHEGGSAHARFVMPVEIVIRESAP